MPSHKSPNIIKYCVITSTTAIVLIFISLIPVSKKAFNWNRCLKKTYQWIVKNEIELKNWDKASKKVLRLQFVMVLSKNLNLKESNLIDSRSKIRVNGAIFYAKI